MEEERYLCKKQCYHNGALFMKGTTYPVSVLGSRPPRHFVSIKKLKEEAEKEEGLFDDDKALKEMKEKEAKAKDAYFSRLEQLKLSEEDVAGDMKQAKADTYVKKLEVLKKYHVR